MDRYTLCIVLIIYLNYIQTALNKEIKAKINNSFTANAKLIYVHIHHIEY